MFAGITPFSRDGIDLLKSHLRKRMPEFKSGHLDEAIARGFGFKTHAALSRAVEDVGSFAEMAAVCDPVRVTLRLTELGYEEIDYMAVREAIWSLNVPSSSVAAPEQLVAMFTPRSANEA